MRAIAFSTRPSTRGPPTELDFLIIICLAGHMVAKASEEFAKSTRLKKEPY